LQQELTLRFGSTGTLMGLVLAEVRSDKPIIEPNFGAHTRTWSPPLSTLTYALPPFYVDYHVLASRGFYELAPGLASFPAGTTPNFMCPVGGARIVRHEYIPQADDPSAPNRRGTVWIACETSSLYKLQYNTAGGQWQFVGSKSKRHKKQNNTKKKSLSS
jgi:hypothetical protein